MATGSLRSSWPSCGMPRQTQISCWCVRLSACAHIYACTVHVICTCMRVFATCDCWNVLLCSSSARWARATSGDIATLPLDASIMAQNMLLNTCTAQMYMLSKYSYAPAMQPIWPLRPAEGGGHGVRLPAEDAQHAASGAGKGLCKWQLGRGTACWQIHIIELGVTSRP